VQQKGERLAKSQKALSDVALLARDGVVAVVAALAVVAAVVVVAAVGVSGVLYAQAIAQVIAMPAEFESTIVLFCGLVGKLLAYEKRFQILSCDAVALCSSL
jgi:hypothetical protein